MKDVPRKDLPAVSGGVKPGDTGDCIPDPFPLTPYPQFPVVPLDPEYTDPRDI